MEGLQERLRTETAFLAGLAQEGIWRRIARQRTLDLNKPLLLGGSGVRGGWYGAGQKGPHGPGGSGPGGHGCGGGNPKPPAPGPGPQGPGGGKPKE